jgi:hypothetical protein
MSFAEHPRLSQEAISDEFERNRRGTLNTLRPLDLRWSGASESAQPSLNRGWIEGWTELTLCTIDGRMDRQTLPSPSQGLAADKGLAPGKGACLVGVPPEPAFALTYNHNRKDR